MEPLNPSVEPLSGTVEPLPEPLSGASEPVSAEPLCGTLETFGFHFM